MTSKDVEIGGIYVTKVSNQLTRVKITGTIDRRGYGANRRTSTHYLATNLATGRDVEIKSAAKLRRRVS